MKRKWIISFTIISLFIPQIIHSEEKDAVSSRENKNDTALKTSSVEDKPIGRERLSWDVFGRKGGYLHPFLSIIEYYTDNVFNTNGRKESDFVTSLSPGIWLAVPPYKKLSALSHFKWVI